MLLTARNFRGNIVNVSMYVRCLHSNLLIKHRHVSCVGRSLHPYLFIPVCLLNMNIYYGVAQNTYPVCAEHCH